MKKFGVLVVFTCVVAGPSLAQERVFNWVRANSEAVQLDPADYHTGRVYHPGSDGGNIHVVIQAKQPVTIAMATPDAWEQAKMHPETIADLAFQCVREHVVSTTFTCQLAPNQPMVLVIHDERTPERAIVTGIAQVLGRGAARQFISPNDVNIQYYSWSCVDNCIQPEFQWVRLVKEKYEVTSVPKIYNVLTPERDGQELYLKIKAPVPMTVAVVPSKLADQVFDSPGALATALENTSCKQRGVQSLSFNCKLNVADGPQSLVVVPNQEIRGRKKAEIEMQAVECTANCNLLNK